MYVCMCGGLDVLTRLAGPVTIALEDPFWEVQHIVHVHVHVHAMHLTCHPSVLCSYDSVMHMHR